MSIWLNLHPVLTDILYRKIGYGMTPYEFSYSSGGKYNSLAAQPPDGHEHRSDVLLLKDDNGIWAHENHSIIVKRSVTLDAPVHLFGSDGIACEDAELGLALLWTSKSSNQTGISRIGSFRKTNNPITLSFEYQFDKGTMNGKIGLSTILFLSAPGVVKAGEEHLANSSGMLLGFLDRISLIIDGSGSVFPVVEVDEPGKPLWWVNCTWQDPCVDSFDEDNVRICLNRSHNDFSLLRLPGSTNWSPMLKEVIASAMQIIIQKVKDSDSWEFVMSGEMLESGSIGHSINYSLNTFDWNTDSPENLARSIRHDLDKRISMEII